ncbi:MAG: hypothetical protein ACTSWN_16105, partial [Promethearchaeota archaeon]
AIFGFLDDEKIKNLHEFLLENNILEFGIDAYCPDCNAIYCRQHYNVEEVWDAGFYDYSEGTCPKRHRRMIDD